MTDEEVRTCLDNMADRVTVGPWSAQCLDEETDCWQVPEPLISASASSDGDYLDRVNAEFIAAAREGWPAALTLLLQARALLRDPRAGTPGSWFRDVEIFLGG